MGMWSGVLTNTKRKIHLRETPLVRTYIFKHLLPSYNGVMILKEPSSSPSQLALVSVHIANSNTWQASPMRWDLIMIEKKKNIMSPLVSHQHATYSRGTRPRICVTNRSRPCRPITRQSQLHTEMKGQSGRRAEPIEVVDWFEIHVRQVG